MNSLKSPGWCLAWLFCDLRFVRGSLWPSRLIPDLRLFRLHPSLFSHRTAFTAVAFRCYWLEFSSKECYFKIESSAWKSWRSVTAWIIQSASKVVNSTATKRTPLPITSRWLKATARNCRRQFQQSSPKIRTDLPLAKSQHSQLVSFSVPIIFSFQGFFFNDPLWSKSCVAPSVPARTWMFTITEIQSFYPVIVIQWQGWYDGLQK